MNSPNAIKNSSVQKTFSNENTPKNDVTDELIKLNDFYKSGVLTKEEFERAKSLLLN